MKKILITGICGFSGTYLAKYLLAQNVSIYGIDIKPRLPEQLKTIKPNIKLHKTSLLDKRKITDIIKRIKPDYIFHLAGLLRSDSIETLLQTNVLGTKNILDAAIEINAKVLISGSSAEYGWVSPSELPITEEMLPHPVSSYGISKLAQTLLGYSYFKNRNLEVYLTRTFNITGPGEPITMLCASLAQQVKDIRDNKIKPVIYVGNLTPKRDFVDVRDVVRAYWQIINCGNAGEIYNICSGRAYSVKEVLVKLLEISRIKKISIKQSRERTRLVDIPIQIGDNTKIRKEVGWTPQITLEESLRDSLIEKP